MNPANDEPNHESPPSMMRRRRLAFFIAAAFLHAVAGLVVAVSSHIGHIGTVTGENWGNVVPTQKKAASATTTGLAAASHVTDRVHLQGKAVGTVLRICPRRGGGGIGATTREDDSANNASSNFTAHECWSMDPRRWDSCNNNGPALVRSRSWMHPTVRTYRLWMYFSSHGGDSAGDGAGDGQQHGIEMLVAEGETESWMRPPDGLEVSFPPRGVWPCRSLHSPSVVVDDEARMLFMYVHGHKCRGTPEKKNQPTLLLISNDGISWSFPNRKNFSLNDSIAQVQEQGARRRIGLHGKSDPGLYIFEDLFYLSAPVEHQGHYYAMAKSQEDPVGSAVLCRSPSLWGPFEKGPVLAKGLRHSDLHMAGSSSHIMYIFFTLIGDKPEKVLVGTVDTTSSSNWMHWKLLPGPTLLSPSYEYEHGGATLTVSESGQAICSAQAHLRDPNFLPDDDDDDDDPSFPRTGDVLSGLLAYSVQGERAIAVARIALNLTQYLQAVPYRDKSNIDPIIYQRSSLRPRSMNLHTEADGAVLVTGTGRSGTTWVCTYFNLIGIHISHDNDNDCGKYPGPDGAASWYDAFKQTHKGEKQYDIVLHGVRHPLAVINSRVHLIYWYNTKEHLIFLKKTVEPFEDTSELDRALQLFQNGKRKYLTRFYSFALKHWVRRNSFVQQHASWRVRVEDASTDPLHAWQMCMAAAFGPRCPNLNKIRQATARIDKSLNTKRAAIPGRIFNWTWNDLESHLSLSDQRYVVVAKQMAHQYGYHVPGMEVVDRVNYWCGWTSSDRWDCEVG